MKVVAFFPAHPAQLWMMHALSQAAPDEVRIVWLLRDKDVLLPLADRLGLTYEVISRAGAGFLGNAVEMTRNFFACAYLTRKLNIDLWLSKYGAANLAARIMRCRSISFNDDDADAVPLIAATSYPFSNKVLVTQWTRMGRYEKRATRYRSFHELFYLHPNRFTGNRAALVATGIDPKKPYLLLRFSALQAHHDAGIKGLAFDLLDKIILLVAEKFDVLISSEKKLPQRYEAYRANFPVEQVHQVIANAAMVVGDSQTMIAEAAVLGVPAIRVSDFVGRLGYLEELERRGLCFGFRPDETQAILDNIQRIAAGDYDTRARELLLQETIDPVPFFWDQIMASLAE
jgi:predicted glycosyltransferase